MTNRAVATRYARALLEVSEQQGSPDDIEQELAGVVDLMEGHLLLRETLVSPTVPPSRKRAVLKELIPKLDGISVVTGRLLMMMADRDRLGILAEVLQVYRARVRKLKGVVRARVTTVTPLPPERVQAIAATLASVTGKQVEIEASTDATLLGGMVTQIGSTVYDGSISQHLQRLRRRFLA